MRCNQSFFAIFLLFRVESINNHLKETTRENETKVQQITKKVNGIEDRLTRMEEYTIQILDMLANVQEPLSSPTEERDEAMFGSESWTVESRDQEAARSGPSCPARLFSRMMSVPAYVHRQQAGTDTSTRSIPMYFRHKLPHSNPFPAWYRQVSKRSSIQKAIRKFRRSNTLPSLDEPSEATNSGSAEASKIKSQIAPGHVPPQMPLKRADSEGAVQSEGLISSPYLPQTFKKTKRILNQEQEPIDGQHYVYPEVVYFALCFRSNPSSPRASV